MNNQYDNDEISIAVLQGRHKNNYIKIAYLLTDGLLCLCRSLTYGVDLNVECFIRS